MQSLAHAGPTLSVKVFYPDIGTEKLIGFASDLTFDVTQGQKAQFVVDSPFPAQIDQAAGQSSVKGSITLFLPKGSTPESSGLVPFRKDQDGGIAIAATKYIDLRIYDRATSGLLYIIEGFKASQTSVAIGSRRVVQVRLQFEARYLTVGNVS